MFVPPGYHLDASISGLPKPEKEEGDVPYTYAPSTGLGYVMMNGCWGKNYTASDPCYNAKWTSSVCQVGRDEISSFVDVDCSTYIKESKTKTKIVPRKKNSILLLIVSLSEHD